MLSIEKQIKKIALYRQCMFLSLFYYFYKRREGSSGNGKYKKPKRAFFASTYIHAGTAPSSLFNNLGELNGN